MPVEEGAWLGLPAAVTVAGAPGQPCQQQARRWTMATRILQLRAGFEPRREQGCWCRPLLPPPRFSPADHPRRRLQASDSICCPA